jgi:hypothetical protein
MCDEQEVYGLDDTEAECIICLTDIRDTILLPCKHICVCRSCHKSINKCPICRSRIGSYMAFTEEESEEMKAVRAKAKKGTIVAAGETNASQLTTEVA